MSDKKISELTEVTTLVPGTDMLAIVNGGVTKKISATALHRTIVEIIPIDYEDSTGDAADSNSNAISIPANTLVTRRDIVETTAWDAITSFELGWSGDNDALITNAQCGLTGNDPTTIDIPVLITQARTATVTWNQGAATQGVGYIVLTYVRLD